MKYEMLAEIIRRNREPYVGPGTVASAVRARIDKIADDIGTQIMLENPGFDPETWLKACGR